MKRSFPAFVTVSYAGSGGKNLAAAYRKLARKPVGQLDRKKSPFGK